MVRAVGVDDTAAQAPARGVTAETSSDFLVSLRSLALRGLEDMYDSERGLFVFRIRRAGSRVVREGHSHRYTAISLIGLAGEDAASAQRVLGGRSTGEVAAALVARTAAVHNLGDLALTAWAAHTCGCPTDRIWERVAALRPETGPHPTIEVAWTLSALAFDTTASVGGLRERLSERLRRGLAPGSALFPHALGSPARRRPQHVTCFADFVYPTMALAQYGAASGDRAAVACAVRSAAAMCRRQGASGQWWWHYDCRTGRVIEKYPVYAVHQDSMAPMALFAVAAAARTRFDEAVGRGLDWLVSAPELDAKSLVDRSIGFVWRKVARREPAKLSRYVQATASYISPRLRVPSLDPIFPPTAIDYEDRPYHFGWLLYAWPAARASRWSEGDPS